MQTNGAYKNRTMNIWAFHESFKNNYILMKNICIDLGNTFSKIGYFDGEKLLNFWPKIASNNVVEYCKALDFDQIMISSVTKDGETLNADFACLGKPIHIFNNSDVIPIKNDYETPYTLGPDRLAAAVAANALFPNKNCLIIDMGTCIKFDLVEESCFKGGIIAPGLRMRFKAMHQFTKKLPLIENYDEWPHLIGKNTTSAMQSGVFNGMLAEINGIIEQYMAHLTIFKIILCGGDAPFFESRVKYPTFVVPEMVPIGLNRILLAKIQA
jgi:type III pantothenate kinase